MKYSKNCVLLAKNFDVRIFVHLLAKICAHLCAFLKNLDVRIFVRLLAKICAHLSSELLVTLITQLAIFSMICQVIFDAIFNLLFITYKGEILII